MYDLRSEKLVVLLDRHRGARLDDLADHVVGRNVVPKVDAHGLLAVEQRVCYAAHLPEDHVRNVPGVAVLLESADVEPDGLLDDVVLAVGHEEGPVREVHDGRHDDHAREEGRVVD